MEPNAFELLKRYIAGALQVKLDDYSKIKYLRINPMFNHITTNGENEVDLEFFWITVGKQEFDVKCCYDELRKEVYFSCVENLEGKQARAGKL